VLEQIGARDVPQIRVYNKIDILGRRPRLESDDDGDPRGVWLSARTGEGLDLLLEALRVKFRSRRVSGRLRLAPSEGRQRSVLFGAGALLDEEPAEDGGWWLELDMDATDFARFCAHENIAVDRLEPYREDGGAGVEKRAAS